jgi:hypothetical protein
MFVVLGFLEEMDAKFSRAMTAAAARIFPRSSMNPREFTVYIILPARNTGMFQMQPPRLFVVYQIIGVVLVTYGIFPMTTDIDLLFSTAIAGSETHPPLLEMMFQ